MSLLAESDKTTKLFRPGARRPSSRRVCAGLTAPPGVCSQLPAWWGREQWVNVDVWCALAAHPDWCREEHVSPDTVVRVARAHAGYADRATGRSCRPTNERIAADLQVCVRTVQRARRLLKRLGLVVEVVRGRSILTRAERLRAWRRGSSHRRIASEFVLISPRPPPPVDGVTPPATPKVSRESHLREGFFRPKNRTRRGAARPSTYHKRPATVSADQHRTSRLAAGLQQRIGWLRGTSPRRLTCLHRFALQDWTPRDVHTALDEVLRARSWSVPQRIDQPAAYLAALLREVDPADRPGTLEEAMLAERRVREEWLHQTRFGDRECAHGYLAGDLPHPIDGHLACPMCRRVKAQQMTWSQPVCAACFERENPGRTPVRVTDADCERCCLCGEMTFAGIYTRKDPKVVPYPRPSG